MKVLMLTRYGRLGASSRLRSLQFVPWLGAAGLEVTVHPFLDDDALRTRYRNGSYGVGMMLRSYWGRVRELLRCGAYDLVWIEKEALPWLPPSIEKMLLRKVPYLLDYDDAVFHNYDMHPRPLVRILLGRRIDRLMASASLVTAGNEYLAQRARDAGARRVEIIPTVIDLERYTPKTDYASEVPTIVWIGSPSTVRYLATVAQPLAQLAARKKFRMRIIGGQIELPGVDVEYVTWTENSEVASIAACDIGIMPLADSPWERGKCGYKLIQYMACGLSVVASPVGVNTTIVQEGRNGYLANDAASWIERLEALLANPALREDMGRAGRRLVEERYCIQVVAPQLAECLKQ